MYVVQVCCNSICICIRKSLKCKKALIKDVTVYYMNIYTEITYFFVIKKSFLFILRHDLPCPNIMVAKDNTESHVLPYKNLVELSLTATRTLPTDRGRATHAFGNSSPSTLAEL